VCDYGVLRACVKYVYVCIDLATLTHNRAVIDFEYFSLPVSLTVIQ
jgi:hypothetical protein